MSCVQSSFTESRLVEIGRAMAESSAIGTVIWDKDGRILQANEAFADLVGHAVEDLTSRGRQMADLTPKRYDLLDRRAAAMVRDTGVFAPYEKCLLHQSGSEVPVLIGGAALGEDTVGFLLDFTDQGLARQTVERSEKLFRTLARNVPGVVYLCECQTPQWRPGKWRFRFINEAVEDLTGIPARRFYDGRATFSSLRHRDDTPRVVEEVDEAIRQRRSFNLAYRLRHTSGEWRWVEETGQGLYEDGTLKYVEGVIIDITRRKQAEDALRAAHDELEQRVEERTAELRKANEQLRAEQAFLRSTLDQHERHRQVISYDIHDGLAQYITGAVMRLEAFASKHWPVGREKGVDAQFDAGLELLRTSLDEARRLISGLRPPVLDELGLVAAIEYLIGEQPERSTGIWFVYDVQFERLPPLWETNLFRIVQEALANVEKHSQATEAAVELRQDGRLLYLRVADSGCGFDPAADSEQSHGLPGIRRRARLLEGAAQIDSEAGKGTEVLVKLTLPPEERMPRAS